MTSSYVVTTLISGVAQKKIWENFIPLAIGNPFRFVLEKTNFGIRIRDLGGPIGKKLKHAHLELNQNEIKKGIWIALIPKKVSIHIRPIQPFSRSLHQVAPALPLIHFNPDSETKSYFKSVLASAGVFLFFCALLWIWPKAVVTPTEIIPPQYTKIIFSKPKSSPLLTQVQPSQRNSSHDRFRLPKVFQSKALQGAVSALLKGGMTKLLAQSDFLNAGKTRVPGSKIFDTKSEVLRTGALKSGDLKVQTLSVATLGGGSHLNHQGKIGYFKGEHVILAGQGKSQISIDTFSSAVDEGLTKDEVGEVIHRHLSEIRYCYESTMLKTPDLEGRLIIHFLIGKAGSIKTAAVQTSTLPDPRLDDCVLRRLVTWQFPSPKGGIDVAVTYPFIFKTLGR